MEAAVLEQLECRAEQAANLLKAMSNTHRLEILCQLVQGERAVGRLAREIGIGQSAVSQHLAVLRAEGLVTSRREAQTIYYSVQGPEVRAILEALYKAFCEEKGSRNVRHAA